ncbi:hypothetical protein C1645_803822 [Glomus cerebriforme]|uniref:BTB domain-containing protein n=1 Tax=Glomus cerebriforme TaxID=658196 RepID=A0A397T7N0_9GLOM|nr:hypothetical protein C1645_803822 [Glomus cerebriforme]
MSIMESLSYGNRSNENKINSFAKINEETSFTWKIVEFQDLYNCMKNGSFILSEKFSTPNRYNMDNNANIPMHYWRLRLYPRGYTTYPDDLAIFLTAFPSPYENQNLTKSRVIQKFRIELYKLDIGSENSMVTSSESIIHLSTRGFKKSIFKFETNEVGYMIGKKNFCDFKSIFPDNNSFQETTLIIRVYINFEENNENCFTNPIVSQTPAPTTSFVSSFEKFYDDQRFNDVEFSFDEPGPTIRANRFALSSRSSYFDLLFRGELAEVQSRPIPVRGIKPKSFQAIIYYIYTRKLMDDLEMDTLENLYTLIEIFFNEEEIKEIKEKVINKVGKIINIFNWDYILEFSWKIGNEMLKKGGLDFIAENWSEVKQTKQMKRMLKHESLDWVSIIEELVTAEIFNASKLGGQRTNLKEEGEYDEEEDQ